MNTPGTQPFGRLSAETFRPKLGNLTKQLSPTGEVTPAAAQVPVLREHAMPTLTVNVHEAKTHLSRLLDQVQAGEEIILARSGKPCARLVPIEPTPPVRRPGRLKGCIDQSFFDPLPDSELQAWEDRM